MASSDIKETGIRGFLKWLQSEQPEIYKQVAPKISTQLPQAFSDYHAGGWRVAGLTRDQAVDKLNGMGRGFGELGDVQLDSLAFDPNLAPPPTAVTVDTSTAANAGSTSSTLTDTIGSIVSGISALYMTKQQANIQQQVVNTQLQRAALGLPPLPTSLSNLGVPQVSVGLSTGTGSALAIGAALIGAIFILPKLLGGSRR